MKDSVGHQFNRTLIVRKPGLAGSKLLNYGELHRDVL